MSIHLYALPINPKTWATMLMLWFLSVSITIVSGRMKAIRATSFRSLTSFPFWTFTGLLVLTRLNQNIKIKINYRQFINPPDYNCMVLMPVQNETWYLRSNESIASTTSSNQRHSMVKNIWKQWPRKNSKKVYYPDSYYTMKCKKIFALFQKYMMKKWK